MEKGSRTGRPAPGPVFTGLESGPQATSLPASQCLDSFLFGGLDIQSLILGVLDFDLHADRDFTVKLRVP